METLEASAAEWHPSAEGKTHSIDEAFVEILRPAGHEQRSFFSSASPAWQAEPARPLRPSAR